MDISSELTEIRALMMKCHDETSEPLNVKDWEWLQALLEFERCGCTLCQAMIKITALEVNTTLNPTGIGG